MALHRTQLFGTVATVSFIYIVREGILLISSGLVAGFWCRWLMALRRKRKESAVIQRFLQYKKSIGRRGDIHEAMHHFEWI